MSALQRRLIIIIRCGLLTKIEQREALKFVLTLAFQKENVNFASV
jgi:hypothetical protein